MPSNSSSEGVKLNQRLRLAPPGAVLTIPWLRGQGISSRLADYYARSGWLHRIGDGAFTVLDAQPSWLGAVFGLQETVGTVHPGGRTALELAGLAHFLPLGSDYPLHLFSRAQDRLPSWFRRLPWSARVHQVRSNFLPFDLGLQEYREEGLGVIVSTPERAALEFLQHLTLDVAGYDYANLVFEGLGTLRPSLVQQLLEACRSIRVKRLFLHLAEKQAHAWFGQLDLTRVGLGTGKRMLIPGGRLDPKYLITVPAVIEIPPDAP